MSKKLSVYIILILGSLLFIFPFLWMLSTSLKADDAVFTVPPAWLPEAFHWENYKRAFTAIPFTRYIINTVLLTLINIAGVLISSTLTAYAFAKLRWIGRDILFIVVLGTMMIPAQIILIPTFILFRTLNWVDTWLPLTVPAFFGVGGAFFIFLIRQFFKGISSELTESALLDGCSHWHIFMRIIMPLSKAALASVVIFTFIGRWNDLMGPLIYLEDSRKYTIALGLRTFQGQFDGQFNLMMAASLISMIPTLAVFFYFQKYFVEGITFTGIKG